MSAQSFVKYFFVSGICVLLNNLILIAADMMGCTLLISVLLSYVIVVVTGYVLHSVVSFRQPFGVVAFGRYTFAMVANVPLMFGIIWTWRSFVGLPMSFSAPIATGCMFFFNFVFCRWAVLAKSKVSKEAKRSGTAEFDRGPLLSNRPHTVPAFKCNVAER